MTIGDVGQCEAHDLVQTEDDAIDVRCTRQGRCIRERDALGGARLRFVCGPHGFDSAMEVQ